MAHDEFSLIRQWTNNSSPQPTPEGLVVGIGDDAAVFSIPKEMEVVACCDAMIETVHFLRETMNLSDIGYKGMISNISDIAAMGGLPRYALITIGVAPSWNAEECQQVYQGIHEACKQYGVAIIGGDTVSTPDAFHLSITLLGEVERGRALLRSGAKPGHLVFTTGTLGDSAAGLDILLRVRTSTDEECTKWQELIDRHQRPSAQVAAGRILSGLNERGAVNDVSDGLASELWEIAEASDVSIQIEQEKIPLSDRLLAYAQASGQDPLRWALTGGEDYQLVGTVPEASAKQVARMFEQQGLAFILIGRVTEASSDRVLLSNSEGTTQPVPKSGYNHFR